MKLQQESLPPLDSSLLPRAPVQRWHSVSRRSDLRPLSQSRGRRLLLSLCLVAVVVAVGGTGIVWLSNRDSAADGQAAVASSGEVERVAPQPPPADNPPVTTSPAAPAIPEVHIVQQGEVLSAIASKYNTTVEILAEINDIEDVNAIRVGQRLRLVPEGQ